VTTVAGRMSSSNTPTRRTLLLDPPRDHLARAGPGRGGYDALPLHPLDHPRGPVVADAQPPLEPGDRSLAVLGDHADRQVVHLIGHVLCLVPVARLAVIALEELQLVARCLLARAALYPAVYIAVRHQG